jgi:hypothetical protein
LERTADSRYSRSGHRGEDYFLAGNQQPNRLTRRPRIAANVAKLPESLNKVAHTAHTRTLGFLKCEEE